MRFGGITTGKRACRRSTRTAAFEGCVTACNEVEDASAPRQFDVVIERDSEGYSVASVPQLPACHTQARSFDEVTERIREAIELCLEVEGTREQDLELVGIQRVTIAA
jgi:predicted RNase H-like HicB family nuclease